MLQPSSAIHIRTPAAVPPCSRSFDPDKRGEWTPKEGMDMKIAILGNGVVSKTLAGKLCIDVRSMGRSQ